MALLYQEIMSVPGLTGSWQQRNAQLYKLLGSPMGAYKGNTQQNLYLLDQIQKNNYFKSGLPGQQQTAAPAQTATAQPQQTLAQQYTDPLTGQLKNAAEIPQYENVMPFYDAWGRMVPQATQAAASQVNPEAQRVFNQAYKDYMSGMTSSGGQRFGTGLAGVGSLRASAERDRQAQLQDWLNSYQTGYKELFYNPSRDAWNTARTQANFDSTQYQIPTWESVADKYGTMYGSTPTTNPKLPGSQQNYYSPWYGA